MITALGNFFRTSINKGLEYITVNDEISNIHNYILLQKIRYGDKFDVEWDIEEKIRECKIIKLILQPIIENSLNHGLSNMEKGGIIKISAYRSKDVLIFKVADNGVGMTEAECADFLNYINSPLKDTTKSIGAKNVHQRLQLYYGKDYGLSVTRLACWHRGCFKAKK